MREVVLDTETTGLDPAGGHRIVEIGCVELLNHVQTGNTYHTYLNPDRDMPPEAYRVHKLSAEFLADKPRFSDTVDDFVRFIGESPLVIHNAGFDMAFINAELAAVGRRRIDMNRAIDTLALARKKFPGAQTSLDALCRRFGIDNSARTAHGALLDAELLSAVYLEMIGGREPGFELAAARRGLSSRRRANRVARPPRPHAASPGEREAHRAFLADLKDPLWDRESG